MVGGEVLGRCLADPEVGAVTVIGRRPTGAEDPKLTEVHLDDLGDYRPAAAHLAGQDVALYCLGAYTGTLPDDAFRAVTLDLTVAFAQALHDASPGCAVCFLSGQGADQSEQSRMSFARYKGAAEKTLLAAGFPRVHLFRPGYIYPVRARVEPNLMYRVMRGLYPVLRRVYPDVGLRADDLARAMVDAGLHGVPDHPSPVLSNREIRALAARMPVAAPSVDLPDPPG